MIWRFKKKTPNLKKQILQIFFLSNLRYILRQLLFIENCVILKF